LTNSPLEEYPLGGGGRIPPLLYKERGRGEVHPPRRKRHPSRGEFKKDLC